MQPLCRLRMWGKASRASRIGAMTIVSMMAAASSSSTSSIAPVTA